MNSLQRLLLLFPILGLFLPAITCQAKYEQTAEIELIDMGHGIFIPSSFDVVNEDGIFATISNFDLTPWLEVEIDEWNYSITLVMADEAGNHLINTYTRPVRNEKNEYDYNSKKSSDGETVVPLTRTTYSASEDIRKVYTDWGGSLKLSTKYEYNTADDDICHLYNLTSIAYDLDDEYYEACSYRKEAIQEYWLRGPVYDPLIGKSVYQEYPYQLTSVQTINGVEFYLYVLEQWEFDWALEEEREVMEGNPLDITHYFTKEQIEILEAEHITTYEELMERYPAFWDTSFYIPPGVERSVGIPSDGVSEKDRAAQNAIISPNTETPEEIEEVPEEIAVAPENEESKESEKTGSASNWYTSEYGKSLTQPLTEVNICYVNQAER